MQRAAQVDNFLKGGNVGSVTTKKLEAAFASQKWASVQQEARKIQRKDPANLLVHRVLGFALNQLGKTEDAFRAFKAGMAIWPKDAELVINYANTLIEHARYIPAYELMEKVCALRPDKAISWIKLSQVCYETQQHGRGFEAAEKAFELATEKFDKVSALTQRAIHRRELGQIKQAIQDSVDAIAIYPEFEANHTNRLLFMLADPDTDPRSITQAAREYAQVFETPIKPYWPKFEDHPKGPWQRLKIGFLSPDFRNHAVMYFCEGLLAQLDRRQFEVFAFYLYPKEDYVTERVKRHVDHFITMSGLSLREQIAAIHDRKIDILIDMAGHTGHNGLNIMMHKPAPVQASWLGFIATTGLSAIDYYISDEFMNPFGTDSIFTETLYRLPTGTGVYRPMCRNPLWRYQPKYKTQPTPAINNGFVTFGTCNNLGKITDKVLLTWLEILTSVPRSKLLIEGKGFGKDNFKEKYIDRCLKLGFAQEQLILIPLDTANQYLTYHKIDIALDPFPLNGGTTTCDTVWMGVPMVAMAGNAPQGRMGESGLYQINRPEWVAPSPEKYIDIAVNLASDLHELNELRLKMRPAVEQSVLMDEKHFVFHFGQALRSIWLHWVAKGLHPIDENSQSVCIQSWLQDMPEQWGSPPEPSLGIETGKRISLSQAYQRLEQMVSKASASMDSQKHGKVMNNHWRAVTEFCEVILCAIPHDPVALTCLAEVENAHGHLDFAVTYLQYAQANMS